MTVSNLTQEASEVGTGSKTDFSFSFKIQTAADLVVYKVVTLTNVATLMVLTTDYTVAINTTTEGGVVSYVVDPLATETSVIRRVPSLTQDTDVPVAGSLSETQLEGEFDKRAMIDIAADSGLRLSPAVSRFQVLEGGGGGFDEYTADVSVARVVELSPPSDFSLENPTNAPTAFDQTAELIYMIRNPNGADRTMTLGAKFVVSPSVAASAVALSALLSDTINLTDYMTVRYNKIDDEWIIVNFVNGI